MFTDGSDTGSPDQGAGSTASRPADGDARGSAVDLLGGDLVGVAGWSDEDVLAALGQAEAAARRADAWRARLAAEVDDRSGRGLGTSSLAARRGCRNARELIRRLTGAADISVSRWLRLGHATTAPTTLDGRPLPARFAHVAAALHEGRINTDAATRIIDELNPVRDVAGDQAVAAAEDELVTACAAPTPGGRARLDADSVRIQARTWAQFLDQDGTEPDDQPTLARRALRLGATHHGLIKITGLLLPEVAAMLAAYADAATNPRTPDVDAPPTNNEDTNTAGQVGTSHLGRDPRTRPQLMHDILASALSAAARVADQSSLAGNSPTVLVAVRHPGTHTGTGTGSGTRNQNPDKDTSTHQRRYGAGAVFSGNQFGAPLPLSPGAVDQLTCHGATQHITYDHHGAITAIWSPTRTFTPHQRRAITLRDGGCIIPDCHVPAAWCEVHHVTPHAQNPSGTHTHNGVLLCWHHHRTIDTNGWQIRMQDGTPWVQPPPWLHHPHDPHDNWRPATGSPTHFLDTLHHRGLLHRRQ
ncbi:DUF222 domain-containing protein [Cellulomonas sp. JH27-2]|uniref:HNH endonuclease signature motif containing protein n=1 Tax=Cellulomonas sp. JH27-2 TaxID=2774139 RepID=UPI00177E5687|nr:HNH endonuclease signature motif containing protein [Cellulomonas sp. JH27-2]MBD8060271.1 DUF222 domain-containing protein [Cellulomonas sp. JH27-2]